MVNGALSTVKERILSHAGSNGLKNLAVTGCGDQWRIESECLKLLGKTRGEQSDYANDDRRSVGN